MLVITFERLKIRSNFTHTYVRLAFSGPVTNVMIADLVNKRHLAIAPRYSLIVQSLIPLVTTLLESINQIRVSDFAAIC